MKNSNGTTDNKGNISNKDKEGFFAKIPTLYLELHHFTFNHGTYQSPSQNFIGRDEIRNRLRAILTNSNSKSGTYLITGDRGVGKTSLVNKVIEEISSKIKVPKAFIRFMYLAFAILIVQFLLIEFPFIYDYKMEASLICLLCFILFSFYIWYFSLFREKHLHPSIKNCILHFCIFLREYSSWERDNIWSNKLYNFNKTFGFIFLTLCIHFWCDCKPIIICAYFGGYLVFVSLIKGLNRMLYFSNKKNNRDYKASINCDKLSSYMIATFFICVLFTILYLLYSIVYIYIKNTELDFPIDCIMIIFCVMLVLSIFIVIRFIVINNYHNLGNCINTAFKIIIENMQRHYFFKHIFNTPKQLSVKINLGYEELKSIDVLRLISHNITIEYQKYLYNSSFFFWRTLIVGLACLLITIFFRKTQFIDSLENVKIIRTLYSYDIVQYSHSIYDSICLGINHICIFVVNIIQMESEVFNIKDYLQNWNNPLPFKEFLFFLLVVFLYKSTAYIPFLKFIRAPFCNLRKLHSLQDSIAASIKSEEGMSTSSSFIEKLNVGFLHKVEKNYPMSDAHDIEKKLIDIIADISQGWFFKAPQFIIVFDELDKIESSNKEKESSIKTDSFSPDTIRKRQEAVFQLLSSLKYILTTMQAKFIFVAGREIYEASLADAADRSHYLSSIFNDVINVPSFMSDFSDDKSQDICSMTEQYVCRQLLPDDIIVNEFSLNTYYEYLKRNDKLRKEKEDDILNMERQKIVFTLHNFIVYLTYASKGAPKKMINLFENYVKRLQPYDFKLTFEEYEKDSILPITRKYYTNTIFYLKFDFYEQYAINVMSRMVSPIIYRFNRGNIHQYGDKLIVSTLFVLDHLYKFHRFSFSWRALESSPELIDVDKTPELRDHITDLLHFLSQNDLKTIRNGLYDFRFFKKISQEICFLTRVSEYASAIFNFTLDESLAVKEFYCRKLATIREQYAADRISVENSIDGLASIHFALGELSLYDEDIGDAIMEFDSALSILETLTPKEMTSEQIVVLIKTMLSLGIAYEKQSLNDRAMLIYSEVVRILVASKNTDVTALGLVSEENIDRNMVVSRGIYKNPNKEPEIYFKNVEDKKPLMMLLDNLPHLHPDIHEIISKITVYESLRLLYLPLLAKFQMLEKSQAGGIQKTDIKRLLKEFYFLANMLNKDNKNIICSTFYLKVGNILYYKNSKFFQDKEDFAKIYPFGIQDHNPNDPFDKKYFTIETNKEKINNNKDEDNTDALFFYKHSLTLLIPGLKYDECITPKALLDAIEKLYSINFSNWDDNKFILLATILTNIGDVLLSKFTGSKDKEECQFLVDYVTKRNPQKEPTKEQLKGRQQEADSWEQEAESWEKIANSWKEAADSWKKAAEKKLNAAEDQLETEKDQQKAEIDQQKAEIDQQKAKDRWQNAAGSWEQEADNWKKISDSWKKAADSWKKVAEKKQKTAEKEKQKAEEDQQKAEDRWQKAAKNWQQAASTWKKAADGWKQTTEDKQEQEASNKDFQALKESLEQCGDKLDNLPQIIFIYILSSLFYKKGTAYNMTSFQCLRILSVIRYHVQISGEIKDAALFFTKKAINCSINAFKDLHCENKQDIYNIIQDDITKEGILNCKYIIYDETLEALLAYEDIVLHKKDKNEMNIEEFYDKTFKTIHYENVTNIYNRLKLLKFKSEVNFNRLLKICNISNTQNDVYTIDINNPNGQTDWEKELTDLTTRIKEISDKEDKELVYRLIADSIFNLMEVIKFTKIYGETYLLTNLFVADTSHKLLRWLQIKQKIEDKDSMNEYLRHLIGKGYETDIMEMSNWANTLRYYYKVKEMHTEGRTYKDMINRTCFLTDEYSDQRFHFITARERRIACNKQFSSIFRNITSKKASDAYKICNIFDE